VENAASVGDYLQGRLRERLARSPVVGDVRGLGLMIGVEIVADRASREPDPARRERILEEAFKRGLLLLGCGKSTIRLSPPLVIDREDADIAVDLLAQAVDASA
jgi:4-aminobutyrate aminotransferase